MEETKPKKSLYIFSALVILILVAIDQITKYFIYTNMTPYKDEKKVLGDALVIYFIKNTGAAWGSLSNKTIFLLVISILLVILLSYVYHNATKYLHCIHNRRSNRKYDRQNKISLCSRFYICKAYQFPYI